VLQALGEIGKGAKIVVEPSSDAVLFRYVAGSISPAEASAAGRQVIMSKILGFHH
jgi:hypothetical protein